MTLPLKFEEFVRRKIFKDQGCQYKICKLEQAQYQLPKLGIAELLPIYATKNFKKIMRIQTYILQYIIDNTPSNYYI